MSNVYTLEELLDLALQTPKSGTVNFNVLKILLKRILAELNIGAATGEWKRDEESTTLGKVLEDQEILIHPTLRQRLRRVKDENLRKRYDESSEDEEVEDSKSSDEKCDDEDVVARDGSVKAKNVLETKKTGEIAAKPGKRIKRIIFPKLDDRGMDEEAPATEDTSQKLMKTWIVKKIANRLEAVEDELNTLVENVDDIKELLTVRTKKQTAFEKGEKRERKPAEIAVDREEFEDTVEELGEAITRLANLQEKQKEKCRLSNDHLLDEISLKASIEDMEKSSEPINKKLRILSVAVKNIQRVIKEVIYPETCGVSKCMACGRKSELPFRFILRDISKRAERNRPSTGSSNRSTKKKQRVSSSDLKYTHTSLERDKAEPSRPIWNKMDHEDQQKQSLKDENYAKSNVPDYPVDIGKLSDPSNLAVEFQPLRQFPDLMRRKVISLPLSRSKDGPVSISIFGNEDSEMCITRYGKRSTCK